MTLTKADLADSIYSQFDFNKKQSTVLIESLLELIKMTLESGEDVMISGFGKFNVKDKSQRRGRNPATGNDLMLEQRRVVAFKCAGILRDRINGNL